MIRNILFDIGNVLIGFNWDDYIHRLFGDDEALISAINLAVWGDGRWDNLDWGKDTDEVIQSMIDADPKLEPEIRKIFANIHDVFSKRDYAKDWLKSLKSRGYHVYYLSNYSYMGMNANPEVLDFLPLMDGGVFSCHIKMIKPHRDIYEHIAKKYDLVPNECVFIDDLAKNIQAARDFGFHGIQFVSHEQVVHDLEALLTLTGGSSK